MGVELEQIKEAEDELTALLLDSYLTLTTGGKNQGKTALAYYQGELLHDEGFEVVTMPFKEIPHDYFTDAVKYGARENCDWMKQTSPFHPILKTDTVYICDDWHLIAHARRSQKHRQINMNMIQSIARHHNRKFLLTSQLARQVDPGNIWDIDTHFLKKPALNHLRMERSEFKYRVKQTKEVFEDLNLPKEKEKTIATYYTIDEWGLIEDIPTPSFWHETLSRYLRGVRRKVQRRLKK